jgi:hypothetical protein
MHDPNQKFTVFDEICVREQHTDVADRNLPPSNISKVIASLKASMLYELMKSLRSALYIRRKD